jgi:hypothetical protein
VGRRSERPETASSATSPMIPPRSMRSCTVASADRRNRPASVGLGKPRTAPAGGQRQAPTGAPTERVPVIATEPLRCPQGRRPFRRLLPRAQRNRRSVRRRLWPPPCWRHAGRRRWGCPTGTKACPNDARYSDTPARSSTRKRPRSAASDCRRSRTRGCCDGGGWYRTVVGGPIIALEPTLGAAAPLRSVNGGRHQCGRVARSR